VPSRRRSSCVARRSNTAIRAHSSLRRAQPQSQARRSSSNRRRPSGQRLRHQPHGYTGPPCISLNTGRKRGYAMQPANATARPSSVGAGPTTASRKPITMRSNEPSKRWTPCWPPHATPPRCGVRAHGMAW
jgi:hypothetical protein